MIKPCFGLDSADEELVHPKGSCRRRRARRKPDREPLLSKTGEPPPAPEALAPAGPLPVEERRQETAKGSISVVELNKLQQTVSRRMSESKATAPTSTRKLSIRAVGPRTQLEMLSGGNQQKVALARALESDARVLLAEEPTQGIDMSSKADVRVLMREFAATERAVVVATSEFEELIGLADHVIVLSLGRVAAKLSGEAITYRNILDHALP